MSAVFERYFSPDATDPAIPVKSFCAYLDVNEVIAFSDLSGITIESSKGTAVLAVDGNNVKATTGGTVWSLVLSNGAELPLQGSLYDISGNDFHGVSTTGDLQYRQDTYHYNLNYGCDIYTKDGETGLELSHKLLVPYVGNVPVVASVAGYTKQKSCPRQKYKTVVIPNGSETFFRFPAGSVMDKSNSMNIVLTDPANGTKLELDEAITFTGYVNNISTGETVYMDTSTDGVTWNEIDSGLVSNMPGPFGKLFSVNYTTGLPSADYDVNDTIYLRARYDTDTISATKTISTISTITITAPTTGSDIILDVAFLIEGTTNASAVDIFARTSVGDVVNIASNVDTSSGSFSQSGTFTPADFDPDEAISICVRDHNKTSNEVSKAVTARLRTISGLSVTPSSPTAGTNFAFAGSATYLNGETLTLEYNDGSWKSLGTASVGSGTWSKSDCQIATAGTYDLRARYGTAVYSSSLDVTVESGAVTPTTDIYYSFDVGIMASSELGDVFQSKASVDNIVQIRTDVTNQLLLTSINTKSKTASDKICTSAATGLCRFGAEAISATDCQTLFSGGSQTFRITYTANANYVSTVLTGGEVIVGFFQTSSGLRFLLNDGKLYSSADLQNFALTNDLSAIIAANNTVKSCAYNSTDNYLYVLNTSTYKVYIIDLDDNSKIGEITIPNNTKGIVYHKGRLCYCYYYYDGADKIKTVILKNSDDA